MNSLAYIPGSDGAANASLMTVTNVRSAGATTIQVNTVANAPTKFYASMGTPNTFTDPVTGETITVISEATAVDFAGIIDGSNVEIVEIAPGYTDGGSEVGDIIIIRPVTEWANNLFNLLSVAHNDDGSLKGGVLENVRIYTADDTWTKPAGLRFVEVEVVGGGGAGGRRVFNSTAGWTVAGAGGGGGGYSSKKILAADLADTETVKVGAAGASSVAVTSDSGGESWFGTDSTTNHLKATGGGGAAAAGTTTGTASESGGAGGVATGGDMNINGQNGKTSVAIGNNVPSTTAGDGGDSHLGSGGKGLNGATGQIGAPPIGYGAGGAGIMGAAGNATAPGDSGTQGVVIVREYF